MQMRFHHMYAPPASLGDPEKGPGPPVKCALGLPIADRHCLLQASRSGGLRHLARRDIAVGAHARLSVYT
jgi:hypothetical protein